MINIVGLVKLDLKTILREKVNWILNIVIIVQILTLFNSRENKFQALYSSGFITQTIIVGFMILGFNIFRKDKEYGYCELLNTVDCGKIKRNISNLLAGIIYVLLNNILWMIIVSIYYILHNISLDLVIHSISYIVLYWLMPSITAMLIGSVLAFIKTSKSMYSLIVVISMIIGPISKNLLKEVVYILPAYKFMHFFEWINIGQFFINGKIDPLYGFEVESFRFWSKGLFLIIMLSIFVLLNIKKYVKGKIKMLSIMTSIFSLIIVFVGCAFSGKFIYKQGVFENDCIQRYDYEYYEKLKDFKAVESPCKLNSMEISLMLKDDIMAQTKLSITALQNLKDMKFSLYHDLKISSINFKEYNLKYKTHGDIVTVELPYKIEAGNEIVLNINYEGNTSPYYYSNKRAALLPGYYNWIPNLNINNSMNIIDDNISSNILTYNYDVKYTLRTNKEVGTNLKKVDKNLYKGISKSGITVIDGLYKNLKVNDMVVFYPRANSKLNDDSIKILSERIYKYLKEISQDFKLNINYKKPIFFVPIMERGSMNIFNTYILDDYICTKMYEYDLDDNSIKEELMESIVEDKVKNKECKNMFNYFYGIWVKNEQNSSPDIKDVFNTNIKTCENIKTFISKDNKVKVKKFFVIWLDEMATNPKFKAKDVDRLLKSMR